MVPNTGKVIVLSTKGHKPGNTKVYGFFSYKALRLKGRSAIALLLVLRGVNQNVALAGARGWRQGFALDASDLVTGLGVLVLT